jgi:MTH538 TIR-like domain (DUF1863)
MARHAFYSLHYDGDRSRVAGIRGSKLLVPNQELELAEWDKLKRSGEFAVKRWIEKSLQGRSCTVVLIGALTASRPWVHYEIKRSAELGLGLLGIHVHQLKDAKGQQGSKGANPFEHAACGLGAAAADVPVFDAPETDSKLAYHFIVDNLARWAEEAVAARTQV